MKLAIDGSNLRSGGGLRHLVEFLSNASPGDYGFDKVYLWVGPETYRVISKFNYDWLELIKVPAFDKNLISRYLWRILYLKSFVNANCDVLFSPGGITLSTEIPEVTMSRNMQPFDKDQKKKTGFSVERLRLEILTIIQKKSFKKANAVIFLTEHAKLFFSDFIKIRYAKVIPHGCGNEFRNFPKSQKEFSCDDIINLLYVSTYDTYKHHIELIDSITEISKFYPNIVLNLVGDNSTKHAELVKEKIESINKNINIIEHGIVDQSVLFKFYLSCDISIFASSCENLPNILLESMSSGLPIACSNIQPMPSILKNHGVYFDPKSSHEITAAILKLIKNPNLREKISIGAYNDARNYSWKKCASSTYNLLSDIASGSNDSS